MPDATQNFDTIDFSDLYQLPLNTLEEVKVKILPARKHFYGKITVWGAGTFPARDDRPARRFIQCNVQVTDPGEDVEPSDLDGIDLADFEVNRKFPVSKAAVKYIQQFFLSLGFSETSNLGDCIMQSRGARVLFSGSHSQGRGDTVFYNVDTIVGA